MKVPTLYISNQFHYCLGLRCTNHLFCLLLDLYADEIARLPPVMNQNITCYSPELETNT